MEDFAKHAATLLRFRERFAPPRTAFMSAEPSPYPMYDDDVSEFFRLAGLPPWPKYDYSPQTAQAILGDPARVAAADLEQLREALTYCVRAERFADGAWGSLLRDGSVQRLLERLAALAAEDVGG